MFVDLHIHSCLSPCADDDMTPANICGMAHIKGLDAIAVTDHNTARNLPYVKEAADYYGLILLPGMEITTKEEVHLLGYFQDVETAVEVGEIFSAHLPPMKNKPDFFGNQLVMNTDDEVMDVEERLLIGATDLDLAECTRIIREHGGAAVPAHINRGHGLLVNLGLFPEEPDFPVVEVRPELPVNEKLITGKRRLWSSDAHRLGEILEAVSELEPDRFSIGGLFDFVCGRNQNE
jgi:predicted metal-dependent phosphoesterase TrpH